MSLPASETNVDNSSLNRSFYLYHATMRSLRRDLERLYNPLKKFVRAANRFSITRRMPRQQSQPQIYASYCPILSHAALSSLHGRSNEVLAWIESAFVQNFGEDKHLNLRYDSLPESVVGLQRVFTCIWRLFELHFGIQFHWMGFQDVIDDDTFYSFLYSQESLAKFYAIRQAMHERDFYFEQHSPHLSRDNESPGTFTTPTATGVVVPVPEMNKFNVLQMAAWSLAVSIYTAIFIASMTDSNNSVSAWGLDLLSSWEPRLRKALWSKDRSVSSITASNPPAYNFLARLHSFDWQNMDAHPCPPPPYQI